LYQGEGVSDTAVEWTDKGMLSAASVPWWLWRNRPRPEVWCSLAL